MREAGLDEEKAQGGNKILIFGATFLIAAYMAYEMRWVNHPDKNYAAFFHGMYHGIRNIGVFAFGAIIINGLMERKSALYIGINAGYWIVLLGLVGAMFASFPSFKPAKTTETSMKTDLNTNQLFEQNLVKEKNVYPLNVS